MKKTIYALMICTLALTKEAAKAQLATTVAGISISGYTGDGAAATAAQINGPIGIVADGAGNIYFADYGNGVVRKIDAAGIISTVAGSATGIYPGDGGPATAASIAPTGVAIDGAGNLYIADNGNNRICKVNTAGILSTVAGDGTSGYGGDGGAATLAQLRAPYDLDIDGAGNMYIADRGNNRIRKVDGSGNISTLAGTGTAGYTGDGTAATAAKLSGPLSVGLDGAGNVYVADYNNHVIRKINTAGIITTFAGTGVSGSLGDGGPATAAQLAGVCNVKADGLGNIYLAEDATGNMVRVVYPSGVIDRFAGVPGLAGFSGEGGLALSAKFSNTRGVCADPAGNVYISDAGNARIRKVSTTNHAPVFASGASQTLTVCQNAIAMSINALVVVDDTDASQTKTWSVSSPAAHGTLSAAYATATTGTGLTPTGLSYTPTPGYSGPDAFSIRVTDVLSSDTISIAVTVNAAPAPVLSAAALTLSTTVSFVTYQWLNGSTAIAGETNPTYTATADGSYAVTVTDAGGCPGTSATYALTVPTAVNDITLSGIMLYPNPVTNRLLTIRIPAATAETTHLTITNILGEKVKEVEIATNATFTINLDLPVGLYFLSATTEHGKYQAKVMLQ